MRIDINGLESTVSTLSGIQSKAKSIASTIKGISVPASFKDAGKLKSAAEVLSSIGDLAVSISGEVNELKEKQITAERKNNQLIASIGARGSTALTFGKSILKGAWGGITDFASGAAYSMANSRIDLAMEYKRIFNASDKEIDRQFGTKNAKEREKIRKKYKSEYKKTIKEIKALVKWADKSKISSFEKSTSKSKFWKKVNKYSKLKNDSDLYKKITGVSRAATKVGGNLLVNAITKGMGGPFILGYFDSTNSAVKKAEYDKTFKNKSLKNVLDYGDASGINSGLATQATLGIGNVINNTLTNGATGLKAFEESTGKSLIANGGVKLGLQYPIQKYIDKKYGGEEFAKKYSKSNKKQYAIEALVYSGLNGLDAVINKGVKNSNSNEPTLEQSLVEGLDDAANTSSNSSIIDEGDLSTSTTQSEEGAGFAEKIRKFGEEYVSETTPGAINGMIDENDKDKDKSKDISKENINPDAKLNEIKKNIDKSNNTTAPDDLKSKIDEIKKG